jgi:hypothetical protein
MPMTAAHSGGRVQRIIKIIIMVMLKKKKRKKKKEKRKKKKEIQSKWLIFSARGTL